MAPKASKNSKGKQPQEDKRDQPLQAVIVADTFESRFRPLTNDVPRCLLPLANTPIIEYTLEFLARNGVQEVIIYASNHTDQLEEYINASKWKQPSSPFHEVFFFKTAATSTGDFLRDLDRRDLVNGDFIIVTGDVVSNVDLGPALAKHKARREKDKNAIMTMILRESDSSVALANHRRKPVFVLNPRIDRCLHYEEVGGRGASKYITLDPEFLTTNDELEIREDLIDPNIDICTPDVLVLWTDNFDFQSLRKNFLFGVLKDHELNGKTIHTHIIRDQYANRVATLKAYSAITKDVLDKRVYPFDPECNTLEDQSYRSTGGNLYREDDVNVARTATVAGSCILGRGSKVGERTNIVDSSVGRACNLGKNVTLERTQIWGNVIIEDDAKIVGPVIVGNNVHIGAGASILPGSVIQSGIEIAGGATISRSKMVKGQTGSRAPVEYLDDSDVSSQASLHLYTQPPSASGSQSSISTFASSNDNDQEDTFSRRSSVISDRSDEPHASKDFVIEATANILDGLSKNESPDAIIIEMNGFRMSVNASQHQVRHAVVAACMKRVIQLSEGKTAKGPVQTVFQKYQPIFERVISQEDAEKTADQADFLLLAQREVLGQEKGDQLLLFVTQQLYELEVVDEDGVLEWWEDPKSQTGDLSHVRKLTEPFITWLREIEESDDGSEKSE